MSVAVLRKLLCQKSDDVTNYLECDGKLCDKSGFFTYEDIDHLAYRLLLINSDIAELVSKRFPVVIVDECQDLSYAQLQILQILHRHGTAIHLIGDLNQAIYEFRQIGLDGNAVIQIVENQHVERE